MEQGLFPPLFGTVLPRLPRGALSSNIYDLLAWDNALIHGKVVSSASFSAMTTPNGFQIPGGGSYGFGLALSTFGGWPMIWHNGQIGGFAAETAIFLDTGFSVVVLTNDQDADPDTVVLKLMSAVCNSSQPSESF